MLCSKLFSAHPLDAPEQLTGWVRQAGQIALCHFKHVTPQSKPDHSFCTQVDLEIERFLAERIRATFPEHGLISEEGTRIENGEATSEVWVIDPLDGTTAFVQGLPGWGISIGLLHKGQPCFGLFYMPLTDDLTYTTGHSDVCSEEAKLNQSVCTNWGHKGFLAVSASAHHDFHINVQRTRTPNSVGASLVYTARGSSTAAFIPKARLWDLVPGAAILERAGGQIKYLSGQKIDYLELLDGRLAPEPIIAGHPQMLEELPNHIRPRSDLGVIRFR